MKTLMISALILNCMTLWAQEISLQQVKTLFAERQLELESINPGMSKKIISLGSFTTEHGEECSYKQTAVQTILKIEQEKMIVLSQDGFSPANSAACRSGGIRPYQESVLFYEALPKINDTLEFLESSATNISQLTRVENIVTMKVNLQEEYEDGTTFSDLVTVQYDLTRPLFKNIVLNQGTGYTVTTQEMSDVDLSRLNLANVLFCENYDGDNSECVLGDYSDILFR